MQDGSKRRSILLQPPHVGLIAISGGPTFVGTDFGDVQTEDYIPP